MGQRRRKPRKAQKASRYEESSAPSSALRLPPRSSTLPALFGACILLVATIIAAVKFLWPAAAKVKISPPPAELSPPVKAVASEAAAEQPLANNTAIQGHAVREIFAADAPSEMERWSEIFADGLPVVFRGRVADSRMVRALSHENLVGYADVIGGWTLNKGHGSGPWNSHAHERGPWNLRQVLEYYEAIDDAPGVAALQCFKSQGHLPAMDVLQSVVDSLPRELLQTGCVEKVNWWMSVNGSSVVTGLHVDNFHNFFFATHGNGGKKFILYPPWDTDHLHVWPKVRYYSEVLLDLYAVTNNTPAQLEELWKNPSPKKYPNVAKAKRYDVTLFPGDMLYIPMRWWHSGFNSGDVIGVNTWFNVPNPFSIIFDHIFSQQPEDDLRHGTHDLRQWPELEKLPKEYASLEPLPRPPKSPPAGVHPDVVRTKIQQRQKRIGCVSAKVKTFRSAFADLKQFKEELTCVRGYMREIWQEATELVSGDYPGGSTDIWHKVMRAMETRFGPACPSGSPPEHVAAFERLLTYRHDRERFSFFGLLENAYWGCAEKGTCVAVHQATGRALRSAVAWGECKGHKRREEGKREGEKEREEGRKRNGGKGEL